MSINKIDKTWEELMKECKTQTERDEITNIYLQCNDPYYSDIRKNKRDFLEYPYQTAEMKKKINNIEIPESSINFKGTLELKKKGMAENKEL